LFQFCLSSSYSKPILDNGSEHESGREGRGDGSGEGSREGSGEEKLPFMTYSFSEDTPGVSITPNRLVRRGFTQQSMSPRLTLQPFKHIVIKRKGLGKEFPSKTDCKFKRLPEGLQYWPQDTGFKPSMISHMIFVRPKISTIAKMKRVLMHGKLSKLHINSLRRSRS
jgi:hypothetical protein